MKKLLILALILLVGCQSIWDRRIGVYTYQNALGEYGPPDKSEMLVNKCTVARWELPEKTLVLIFGRSHILVSYRIKKTKANDNIRNDEPVPQITPYKPPPPQPEPTPPTPPQPEPTPPLKPVSGPSIFTGRKKYINHWTEGGKQAEWHLKDGKRDGPCKWWHRNGEMWKKCTYRLELLNGRYTTWYRTRVKKESFKYDKGKLIVARIWQPNGTICPITKIDEDGNGVLTEYSEDGKLFNKLIYKDGHLLPGTRVFLPENFEAISQDFERTMEVGYEGEMRKARESQMLRTLQEIENETNTRMIQMIKASDRKR